MYDDQLFTRFAVSSSIAFGLLIWSISTLFAASRSSRLRLSISVMAASTTTGSIGLLVPTQVLPVACFAFSLALLHSAFGSAAIRNLGAGVASAVLRPVRLLLMPRIAPLTVLLLVLAVWGYESWRFEAVGSQWNDGFVESLEIQHPASLKQATQVALTDRGREIPLFLCEEPLTDTEIRELEHRSSSVQSHLGQWIRQGPPSDESNCHGWVFADGDFIVRGGTVENILIDNGYHLQPMPSAGDLVVYRNAQKNISHTALVRAVMEEGDVLVESKWGRLGVYLHMVDESCYQDGFQYYRTARGRHALIMASPEKPVKQ